MTFKRTTVILVLFVFCAGSLLATDPLVSRTFKLTHTITVDSRYSFYFKSTAGDNPIITSAELDPAQPRFARFGITLNWRIAFTSIVLEFNPLEHTTEDDVYYDYSISVVEPHTETQLVDTTPKAVGHGSCTAELVESGTVMEFEKTIDGPQQDFDIADFLITLDDTNTIPGRYQGSIVCAFTVR